MDAPKCRLCGERHYGLCKGIRAVVKNASDKDISDRFEPAIIDTGGSKMTIGLKTLVAHTPTAGETITVKFDRNAYQRDYMRKRRAADKAKKLAEKAKK